jgi:hypothetical protein
MTITLTVWHGLVISIYGLSCVAGGAWLMWLHKRK